MKPDGCPYELLRLLSWMPFLDRLEMAAVSGRSRSAVYEAVRRMEDEGLAAPVPHATDLTPLSARYHLTADGVRRLAREEGVALDDLLRERPVSLQWRAVLLKRLDAAAVVYRLASAVSNAAYPMRLLWYRAMPMDAAMLLPKGRRVAVVRQGPTSDRTAFSKRMRRVLEGQFPGGVLMIVSDDVRLRHARRMLARAPRPVLLALERDVATAGADDPIWHTTSATAGVDLKSALDMVHPGGEVPEEQPLARVSLPWDMPAGRPGMDLPDHALPTILKSAEKRALDLISDWPWITRKRLASLMAASEPRASQVLAGLEEFGLAIRLSGPRSRIALADRGLAVLAHRDRASLSIATRRWSAEPIDPEAPLTWRNVSGSRCRQLLRNAEHTEAVHAFLAALVGQASTLGWEIAQLDPPHRASRHFRHDRSLRSIQPDAFAVLRKGRTAWPFFLEYERRAVRPATMASRIAPHLRYHSTRRPADDHGQRPALLVVFGDDLAAARFLGLARQETDRAGVELPLWVSHRSLLERVGPLGRAWRTPDGRELEHARPVKEPR